MKLCEACNSRPVASARSRYCLECRDKMKGKRRSTDTPDTAYTGCDGCVHWRDCGCGSKACHLTIDTGRLITIPHKDCYKHEGTDYKEADHE